MADKEKKVKDSSAKKADEKTTEQKAKKPNLFVRMFKGITGFFKTFKSESKKVSWPDSKVVLKNTGIVLVMVLVIGVIIFGIDTGLTEIIMWVKKMAQSDAAFISSLFLM